MASFVSGLGAVGFPVLSVLIGWPVASMALLSWLRLGRARALGIGLFVAAFELAIAVYLLVDLDFSSGQMQLVECWPLLPFLDYHLAVDGLSILFVNATAFLGLLLVLYGGIVRDDSLDRYVAAILGFESVLIGLFCAQDLLLFWLLMILEMVPAAYISMRWGTGAQRYRATLTYLRFMGGSLLLWLGGLLIVGWNHAQTAREWSFELTELAATAPSARLQAVALVLIFYAISIRLAQFPFHAWLPQLAQHCTLASVGVFLVGSKVGIYALLRFVLPVLPDAAHTLRPLAVTMGLAGVFYGALLALMQLNLRRLLAFASVNQTGMLVVGVFCLNRDGLAGSLLLAINFGVAASALLLASGLLLHRAGSSLLPRLGELFDPMPLLAMTFLVAALSTVAMPGTPGFDAAHMLLEGAIQTHDWAISVAIAVGNVLAAAFLLRAFQQVFLAHRRESAIRPLKVRVTWLEIALNGLVCAGLLGVGFYSEPWLKVVDQSVRDLAGRFDAYR